MNHANLVVALRACVRRKPFRPFMIEFTSGDRLTVTHPEAVSFRRTVLIYFSPRNEFRLFDSDSVCQLLDLSFSTPA